MRRYWLRIAAGALGIFAIGMLVVSLSREGIEHARGYFDRASTFNIPFAIIPFKFDGRSVGSIRQISLDRAGPDDIRGVRLVVRLDEGVDPAPWSGCALSATGLQDIDERTTFTCAPSPSGEMVSFGQVTFEPTGQVAELMVPAAELGAWSSQGRAGPAAAVTEAQRAVVEAKAGATRALLHVRDSKGRDVVQLNADSAGAFLRIRDRQGREVVKLRADSGGVVLQVRDDSGKVVDIQASAD